MFVGITGQGQQGNQPQNCNPLGLGLNLGALPMNPALVAAALNQAGWGLIGNLQNQNENFNPNFNNGPNNNSGKLSLKRESVALSNRISTNVHSSSAFCIATFAWCEFRDIGRACLAVFYY